ncbi:hypothetical protein A2866_06105 [Candidatus Roizmanbacteria bacterium RIFCSPHIGHO2_01_FULL_39_8]|uniref:Uncharacterized protein n=3 Tax=Candidatus Roizmaniibacteriota TaxID=1752723 RepID=A0A1F7GSF3_9BACT|nr:MAG: hypothetical protein A2866_06105 [Candidatus Roizmanbacteria bacterium RIFCSPHIGHO2_01_FULL_39_8]OGK27211.1 MAG: hypothetical protein A3C28_04205 [Candidatus Roizmanbacteria bacterium RIFCSPHIGHO2_02_FULL_39_9]OGK37431.1 MAG: hypothetical protein A3F60_00690 [Candidatus Roizmanbacteria bacterium RIFCSPHIGHO2_12_FULL_39_8]
MLIQELPLYPIEKAITQAPVKSQKMSTSQQPIHPLAPLKTLDNLLLNMFPQNKDKNRIIQTRKLLGKTAENLSNEQIHCIVTKFQFLINSWLDEFEKEVFGGKTLKEVLNEK